MLKKILIGVSTLLVIAQTAFAGELKETLVLCDNNKNLTELNVKLANGGYIKDIICVGGNCFSINAVLPTENTNPSFFYKLYFYDRNKGDTTIEINNLLRNGATIDRLIPSTNSFRTFVSLKVPKQPTPLDSFEQIILFDGNKDIEERILPYLNAGATVTNMVSSKVIYAVPVQLCNISAVVKMTSDIYNKVPHNFNTPSE